MKKRSLLLEKGGSFMKAVMVFTGSGPILILTSYSSIDDPNFVGKLKAKGIKKFIVSEIPMDQCENLYGSSYFEVFIVGEKVPIPPQPVLTLSTHRAFVGQTVTLNGTQTTDPDEHGIKEYFWWIYRLDREQRKINIWNATTTQNVAPVAFNQSYLGTSALFAELE
jgi:hypothetical protein